MKKFKSLICSVIVFALVLAVEGCSSTDERSGISGELLVVSDSTPSEADSGTSSESVESEPFVNEEIAAVVERIAVSERNAFVDSPIEFTVDDDNAAAVVDVTYSDYVDVRTLMNCLLDIEVSGGTYELGGGLNEQGGVDLTGNAYITVTDEYGKRKRFTLTANRTVHDLPIVNILLGDSKAETDIQRDVYSGMEMYIDCSGAEGFSDTTILSGGIRGRGHSSWSWDKKPYRIKLDTSVPILGMPKNRDWILLSNYADKSLMRNIVAYDMGRGLDFIWTPTQYPVDLFVNGVYRGVYALGEHREISQHRINIDESDSVDRGYVLEVGGADGEGLVLGVDYFHTNSNSVQFITFVDPDTDKLTAEQRQFVMDYVNAADAAIVSGEGYENYIDVESFCDWIIMHELTCNLDSCFRRSCYITKDKGGKIEMGPIWDFDMAFGNFVMDNASYNTWFTLGTTADKAYVKVNWCNYLMKNESFRAKIKARWFEVRDELLERAHRSIAENKAKIAVSQTENFAVWDILGKKTGYQSWATANIADYDSQVDYLEEFIEKRAKWIDENI